MTFRSDDQKKILYEFIEWLYQHEWLQTRRCEENDEASKRRWLVDEFYRPKEIR